MLHDIELTKKGEAYALRHNPTACPAGVEPRLWRKALSRRVETHLAIVTALLSLLDGLDGDCDDEPLLGAPEIPPTRLVRGGRFGWYDEQGTQEHWAQGLGPMAEEAVDEDGGDVLDEPHDAELDMIEGEAAEDMEPDCDDEPEDWI